MIGKLKGSKDSWTDPGCLETAEPAAAFLRFKSVREQVALPYSSLIKLELSTDETALELSFVTHLVTVSGNNLAEIYHAVAEVRARSVRVAQIGPAATADLPSYKAFVQRIRIEPRDLDERRRQ
jgi:hypothetical protein